jgi:acyl-CoA thioesterase-1
MRRPAVVSRPAWINLIAGSGPERKSPVELFANLAAVVTQGPAAGVSGLRGGRFDRWTDGVSAIRADCRSFAQQWRENNERVLADLDGGPVWAVLGDSTAQGIGASGPFGGYVGQGLHELRERTGEPWRVLNLSVSGALIRDVLAQQLPAVPLNAKLVTCGIGANDILFSSPGKLFSDLRVLLAAVPEGTVILDLPLPQRFWWLLGRCSVPYINRVNRVIREVAAERGLPVAQVSVQFTPPWAGKFSVDNFHPSQDGYRDWTRALVAALPVAAPVVEPSGCGLSAAWSGGTVV